MKKNFGDSCVVYNFGLTNFYDKTYRLLENRPLITFLVYIGLMGTFQILFGIANLTSVCEDHISSRSWNIEKIISL